MASDVSLTSSRKTVPSLAYSNSPGRVSVAPVKAPRMCPKSWLSSNVSTSAEQLHTASFCWLTGLIWWMALATSSFPVPVAPQQNVRVMPGHFACKIKHFQHHRAFPHDAVKLQILQQLLLQRLHAPPLVVQRRHLVQRLFQPCVVDRLRQ